MGKTRIAVLVLAFALVGVMCPALALAATDGGQREANGAAFQPADISLQAQDDGDDEGDDEGEDVELPADLNDSGYRVKIEGVYDTPQGQLHHRRRPGDHRHAANRPLLR